MAEKLTLYRLFVAAPSDVCDEQSVIRDVIAAWNAVNSSHFGIAFEAVSWLTHSVSELGGPPQEVLNRQLLASADILVGIFWTRLGTPTGSARSGAVEEIEKFREDGRPAALFFSDRPAPPSQINGEQYEALQSFRETAREWGLHSRYTSIAEFREQFSRFLDSLSNQLRESTATPEPIREYLARWPEFNIAPEVAASRVRTSRASFYTALQLLIGSLEPGSRVVSSDSVSSQGGNGLIYWLTEGLQFLGLTHTAAQRGVYFERVFIVRQLDIETHSDHLRELCQLHNLAGVKTRIAPYESLPPECLYEYVIFGDRYVDEVGYDIAGERIIENWIHWSEQKIVGCRDRSTLLIGVLRTFLLCRVAAMD
jgi:hypothetical protein